VIRRYPCDIMSLSATLFSTASIALLGIQVGCSAPSPTRGGFASPAPAARTYAVEQTVREAHRNGTLSRQDLKSMVELLMADDDLVRFMAIAGLEDLTGETLGYRIFDPPEVRYEAILKWRGYVVTVKSAGKILIKPPPTVTTVLKKVEQGIEPGDRLIETDDKVSSEGDQG
jgi:hypothetical protein